MLGYHAGCRVAPVARYACLGGRGPGGSVESGCAASGRNCSFSAGCMRAYGHAAPDSVGLNCCRIVVRQYRLQPYREKSFTNAKYFAV
jgi:hypothetical protein